jgi:uncharacterized protein YndB with AHSA1/START domain
MVGSEGLHQPGLRNGRAAGRRNSNRHARTRRRRTSYHWRLLEVVEPQRLVFTSVAVDAAGNPIIDGLTTVTFAEHGGKTKLTLHRSAVALNGVAVSMLEGMKPGWTQSLDRLAEHLARS